MAERLSELERWRIAELAARGLTTRLIAKDIGRGHFAVAKHLRVMRRPPERARVRSPLRLSLTERERRAPLSGVSRGYGRGPPDAAPEAVEARGLRAVAGSRRGEARAAVVAATDLGLAGGDLP